jgi:hypothetical protein
MNKFLDIYDRSKLNQEDINHPNSNMQWNWSSNSLPKKKSPGPDRFSTDFYQTFKELIPTLLKLFHQIKKEGALPNSFSETNIILTLELDKDTSKKENYKPISLMNTGIKILNKIMANWIEQHIYQKDHTPWPSQLHPRDAGMVQHTQVNKCNTAY